MIRDCIKILFNSDYAENERVMAGCFLGIYTCFIGMAIIAIAAMITVATAQTRINNETGWEYNTSIEMSVMIDNLAINGHSGAGDGNKWGDDSYCNNYYGNCDVIGAFIERDGEEVCVGGVYAKSNNFGVFLIKLNGAIYLNNECVSYCDQLHPGEIPYYKIWDHTTGVITTLNGIGQNPFYNGGYVSVDHVWADYELQIGDINTDGITDILDVVILVNEVLED